MPNYYNPYIYQQPQMVQQQNQQNQQNQQPQQMQIPPQMQPQIQNGGFISVRSETEARNYPIAIGTSVTFKDENEPYIYNKTMGFSQLEAPRFDKYRLVKEDSVEAQNPPRETVSNNGEINSSIDELKRQTEAIWGEINELKKKYLINIKKKEGAKNGSK